MEIETLKVGELQTNCYIIKGQSEALVIDPGFEVEKILPEVRDLKVKAIVLTHGHYDHATDAFKLKEKIKAPVYIHPDDEALLAHTTQVRADKLLQDGEKIVAGDLQFEVIHTPGHTKGSICLYNKNENALFTGDTLFYHDYGRCDLPGGSQKQMEESLKKLLKLPKVTMAYPGHGRETTIGDEKSLTI